MTAESTALKRELCEYLAGFVSENKRTLFDEALTWRTRHVAVVLEDIADSRDASAVIRSCECYGVQDFYVIARRRSFQVRLGVAMGAAKWIDLHHLGRREEASLDSLRDAGYRIAALSTRPDAMPLAQVPIAEPLAFVFGTEDLGLGEETHAVADYHVRVPSHGAGAKYNLSVCAGLVLYDVTRRLRASSHDWRLSEDARLDLLLEWYAKIPKSRESLVRRFLQERGLDWSVLERPPFSPKLPAVLTHSGKWTKGPKKTHR
ncbi:tRNA (guanosine(18)-2'-O)-methyltransferase [Sulfidibacter corallicola]|uniref:tRNA (guanosine(18)-2'-O)-methyltransferase n=1 Tax=Sulfidibacter corallicola TaxID=2818388 RepID=A0A8A4TP58_SULCO|nr:RNA methyltransferase [Sulfidibacter corallicola]QTD51217.1 RNA methyltransferase [Sulfidibacter corallicola]